MNTRSVSLFEMAAALSSVIDMISTELQGHHKRVAYISANMSRIMNLDIKKRNDVLLAGLLHDCGALSLKEKLGALRFDADNPHNHAVIVYKLLKDFSHFKDIAQIIRCHHTYWNRTDVCRCNSVEVPWGSHIIHIADRVDVLIDRKKDILPQAEEIRRRISDESGKMFAPELVDVFIELSKNSDFWNTLSNVREEDLQCSCFRDMELDFNEILGMVKLIERIIDFRSRFTASHSRGVAAVGRELAAIMNLPESEVDSIMVAGYVHDIGKLAIPIELLEKKERLTPEEFEIIRRHSVYSYNTLNKIKGFDTISKYASFHHERLDGRGYPFKLKADEIPMGSRIIGVADIFTAITEDRPYRKGMGGEEAMRVLKRMADKFEVDPIIVSKLEENYEIINSIRHEAQITAIKEYESFMLPYQP